MSNAQLKVNDNVVTPNFGDYKAWVQQTVKSHQDAVEEFFDSATDELISISSMCAKALENGNKIMLCGNGGSAADAQHIAAEFVGRLKGERRPLASIALTTDTSALTCIGNDYGYDEIFARQVSGLGREGDVLFAISTSGNSENVIRAISAAKEMGVTVVNVIGKDGGKMKNDIDYHIHVPSTSTAHVQECHIMALHMMCDLVEKELGLQ